MDTSSCSPLTVIVLFLGGEDNARPLGTEIDLPILPAGLVAFSGEMSIDPLPLNRIDCDFGRVSDLSRRLNKLEKEWFFFVALEIESESESFRFKRKLLLWPPGMVSRGWPIVIAGYNSEASWIGSASALEPGSSVARSRLYFQSNLFERNEIRNTSPEVARGEKGVCGTVSMYYIGQAIQIELEIGREGDSLWGNRLTVLCPFIFPSDGCFLLRCEVVDYVESLPDFLRRLPSYHLGDDFASRIK